MSKKNVLFAIGVAAVAATPMVVHAATRETNERTTARPAAKDTITCPITGEEISAGCCRSTSGS